MKESTFEEGSRMSGEVNSYYSAILMAPIAYLIIPIWAYWKMKNSKDALVHLTKEYVSSTYFQDSKASSSY